MTTDAEEVDVYLKNINCTDLTQMFGSTIADYIYGLERSQAGAGVAWFKKLFPKPYYAYNAGSLQSVQTSEHKMVGFNQWDEEWENGAYDTSTGIKTISNANIRNKNLIKVVPNATYYIKCPYTYGLRILAYDESGGFISDMGYKNNITLTTPNNCGYVSFFTNGVDKVKTYTDGICINLSWDGEKDGQYEPYVEHTYPLDSDVVLRGIPKLDSGNNLYYDGDVYEADGTVTRRYGVVDLGTLNWTDQSGTTQHSFYSDVISDAKKNALSQEIPNCRCAKYTTTNSEDFVKSKPNLSITVSNSGRANINDNGYTDAASFKQAMSGVLLVYELATPTTETAEPYQNPQIVDDFGTEEYVTTSIVPVGHVTKYQPNLRAKLEMSPDSPDGNGDYIVRQANGENSYVSLASTTTIQDILARLTALEGNTNEG